MMLFVLILAILVVFLTLPKDCSASSQIYISTTSGRTFPFAAIHYHIPSTELLHVPHLLFELISNRLVSKYSTIEVPSFPIADHIAKPDIHSSYSDVYLFKNTPSNVIVHRSQDYTFVFDRSSEFRSQFVSQYPNSTHSLLAVWGPSIMLHPLDPVNHPGVYLNAAVYRAGKFDMFLYGRRNRDILRSTATSSVKHGNCNRIYTLQTGLAYDSSFCRLYGASWKDSSTVIEAIVYDVSEQLRTSVCIQLENTTIDPYCGDELEFGLPLELRPCFTTLRNISKLYPNAGYNGKCDGSKAILEHVSKEWQNGISAAAFRDAGFLFSGYQHITNLVGAAYRSQACNEELSFAWVEHASVAVFAHEVCHMLGALHDTSGIMTPEVDPDQKIVLSKKTQMQIRQFVEHDSRAWCLRRRLEKFPYLQRKYKWNTLDSVLDDVNNTANVSDATFAEAYNDNQSSVGMDKNSENDLVYLISRLSPSTGIVTLHYAIARGMQCDANSRCSTYGKSSSNPTKEHEVPLNFSAGAFAFSIAFARLRSSTSRDFIFMHVRPSSSGRGRTLQRPFYRIAHGIGNDGSPPPIQNWAHEEHTIQNFESEDIQCASISAVSITTNSPNASKVTDLLYVHIDRKNNRNVLQYWIGMNLSESGAAKGGWTEAHNVPGWFGHKTTAVAGAMFDMDGNGMPELILYHVDDAKTIKSGFVRIGKDVNRTGHVTKGWSDFVQSPNINQYATGFRTSGTMAVHPRLSKTNPYGVVAAIQRQIESGKWVLTVGASVLTSTLLNTSRFRRGVEDLTVGCDECSELKFLEQCQTFLGQCNSRIDEVRLSRSKNTHNGIGVSIGSGPALPRNAGSRAMDGDEDTSFDGQMEITSNRPKLTKSESLYCAGFHYFYKRTERCDVVDRKAVIVKGLEVAFREVLQYLDPDLNGHINSTSMVGSPAGTHGQFHQIAAQFEIYGKRLAYSEILRKAFKIIRRRKGYELFLNPETNLRHVLRKCGDIWKVTFFFKDRHFREAQDV